MMSSQTDPHGIVPSEFWQLYDSIEEAKEAHRYKPRNRYDLERCPECDVFGIQRQYPDKPGSNSEFKWFCGGCFSKFDEPAPAWEDVLDEIPDGDGLRKRRENAGLDRGEAADRIGRVKGTIASWERGKHQPSGEDLQKLLKIYDAEAEGGR